MKKKRLSIDSLTERDIPLFLEMIRELAEYEKMADQVRADEIRIGQSLLGDKKDAHALILKWNGEPAGYSVYFYNYSTFEASRGLFIEDIYIRPDYRKRGIGFELFQWYTERARQMGCARIEWMTLKWNKPAHRLFYKAGAKCESDWMLFRMNSRDYE